jgi:hypothetical protein
MSDNQTAQLEKLIRDAVLRILQEQGTTPAAKPEPAAKPVARLLVGICCGDCLNEGAKSALEALRRAGFELIQPEESEFKKRAPREKLVASVDGVLLPSIGDDDAGKMANGIFDEPVARLALSAIATGKPLFAALHSPYAKEIKTRAPQLSRVWEGHKTSLESFGFRIAEYDALPDLVRGEYIVSTCPVVTSGEVVKGKALITAREVEAAAKNGASLKLPPGAIVTPLARDRAKELNVKMK